MVICSFFQNLKIILILFGDYLRSGGDIYMIRNKDNTYSTGREGLLAGESAIFVLDEWVVKI